MLFPLIIFSRKGHRKMTQTIGSRKGSSSVSSRPHRTIRRRLLRFLGILSLSLVGLLLLGLSYQAIASALDASHSPSWQTRGYRRLPAPYQLYRDGQSKGDSRCGTRRNL